MLRTLQNTFISFFVIFQPFVGHNPKYERGIVKRVRWVDGLDEQGIWIGIDHGKLLVWILNSCCFGPWWCELGLIRHIVMGRVRRDVGIL
jgi:hypothetical protein